MSLHCKVCSQGLASPEACVTHFNLCHRVAPTSRFMCCYQNCSILFLSAERFQRHVLDVHTPLVLKDSVDDSTEVCEDANIIKCSLPNCDYTCKSRSTLRSHRKRKHGSPGPSSCGSSSSMSETPSLDEQAVSNEQAGSGEQGSECLNINVDCHPVPEVVDTEKLRRILKEKVVHFYKSLNSVFHIPETTIQHMIETHFTLAKESGIILKEELMQNLRKLNLDMDKIESVVNEAISKEFITQIYSPQGDLRSKHMRQKNYRTGTIKYIKPDPHALGLNDDNEERWYHTVSIKDSILAMMEDNSIYEQYQDSIENVNVDNDAIKDIYDGDFLRTHNIISRDRSVICLLLYQDDLEIVNALGSAKGKHKITVIYFTIGNLKPWCRIKKNIIRLALVVAERDMAYFGIAEVLKPLMAELKELETVGLQIRGEGKAVKVVPILLLGDNLGTHTFTGYLENFSKSSYFCRYCEESRKEWRARWGCALEEDDSDEELDDSDSDVEECSSGEEEELEDDEDQAVGREEGEGHLQGFGEGALIFDDSGYEENWNDDIREDALKSVAYISSPMRTPATYDKCLETLQKRPSQESVKGIVAKCELNNLTTFHCADSSPPCIAHDMFEGVISYDVALAVIYFMKKYSISEDFVNRRVKGLKLQGSDVGDRPAKIKADFKKLKGNAVQNWNFLRFLPLFIGDKICDKNDPVWKMILNLIELTRLLTSPVSYKSSLSDLKAKIHTYLYMRIRNFPGVPLRPKHHYLEHYAELIAKFGNLMRVSTLSFESKHRFFKNTAAAKKNFIRITKTLSVEHQHAMSALAVDMLTCNYPMSDNADPITSVTLQPELEAAAVSYFGSDWLRSMAFSVQVRYHGRMYKKGQAVVTNSSRNHMIEMCLMEGFFMKGKDCYAAGRRCVAELQSKWQVFKLCTQLNEYCVAHLDRVTDYVPYPVYNISGVHVVLLKHMASRHV